jgi:hypothetical protein
MIEQENAETHSDCDGGARFRDNLDGKDRVRRENQSLPAGQDAADLLRQMQQRFSEFQASTSSLNQAQQL